MRALLIFSVVYALALVIPITKGYALYPVAVAKCGKLPIIGWKFKGRVFERPGDSGYNAGTFFFEGYFCNAEDAKAAGYRPGTPTPEEAADIEQERKSAEELREHERRFDLGRVDYTVYLPELDGYSLSDKSMYEGDGYTMTSFELIRDGIGVMSGHEKKTPLIKDGCNNSQSYCTEAGLDSAGRVMTRQYSTWNKEYNERANAFVTIGQTEIMVHATNKAVSMKDLAIVLGSLQEASH